MKKKKGSLLVALLIASMHGMAQSGTPVKGDVNGDGLVNDADIEAVMKAIESSCVPKGTTTYHYFFGVTDKETFTEDDLIFTTTTPTPSFCNKDVPYGTNSYPTFVFPTIWGMPVAMRYESVNNNDEASRWWEFDATWDGGGMVVPSGYTSAFTSNRGGYDWFLSWAGDENPSEAQPSPYDVNSDDKVDIADVVILQDIIKNGIEAVEEPVFHYYLGVTEQVVFTIDDLTSTTNDRLSTIHINPSYGNMYTVFIYPKSWGIPTGFDNGLWGHFFYYDGLNVPEGYIGLSTQGGECTCTIEWQ